jgi:hypothetical protein
MTVALLLQRRKPSPQAGERRDEIEGARSGIHPGFTAVSLAGPLSTQARPGSGSATVAEALSQRQEKHMTGETDSPTGLSFERDVRPMFREKDRDSMLRAFDLWSYSDVHAHQDAILGRLSNGTMPCDGAWPPEHVAVFQRWIASGSAP